MVLIIVLLLDNEMLTSRCDGAVFGAEGPGFESWEISWIRVQEVKNTKI